MVERKFNSLQREIFNFFPTTNNNKLRCISAGLGSELSRTDNRRAMVHGGTQVSHICLGAKDSEISYNVLHIKRTGCNISSHPHGQHGSPIILHENGGSKNQELTAISKEIWQYLLKRKITITAEYLPGSMNVEADRESRQTKDSGEGKLNPTIFMKLCQIRGTPEVDLFASRLSHQLPHYISCKIDPFSQGRGAFQIS